MRLDETTPEAQVRGTNSDARAGMPTEPDPSRGRVRRLPLPLRVKPLEHVGINRDRPFKPELLYYDTELLPAISVVVIPPHGLYLLVGRALVSVSAHSVT